MQHSSPILQGVATPTTSYHPSNDDSKEETREERFQRQTDEAKARAADLQKRYNYLMIKTDNNIGSKRNVIQERAAQNASSTPANIVAPEPTIIQSSIRRGGIPVPTGSPRLAASLPSVPKETTEPARAFEPDTVQPMATSYCQVTTECGDSRESRHRQRKMDAFDKAAELKREYAKLQKPDTSQRNILQERSNRSVVPSIKPKSSQPGSRNPAQSKDSSFPTESMIRSQNNNPELPQAPPDTWQAKLPDHQMDESDLDYLKSEGFPLGLLQCMTDLKSVFVKQIWIVDNSESMCTRDGTVLSYSSTGEQYFTKCTRWEELQECVRSHIKLAGALRQPTSIRLLNNPGAITGPQCFGICETAASDAKADTKNGLDLMQQYYPIGQTPLLEHIKAIIKEVQPMRATLLSSGKRVAITICTDGVPSDATRPMFLEWLRKLEALPVWLVIRLCTNEPHVVDFYNDLDSELESSVDVIDDFQGEALDICRRNPWLNYGLPLHRARERGFHMRVLDFLDECPLSKSEQKEVCTILFGKEKMTDCPDPDVDLSRFRTHIDAKQQKEMLQWDPITGKMAPWVNFDGNNKAKLRKMGAIKRKKTSSFFNCFGM